MGKTKMCVMLPGFQLCSVWACKLLYLIFGKHFFPTKLCNVPKSQVPAVPYGTVYRPSQPLAWCQGSCRGWTHINIALQDLGDLHPSELKGVALEMSGTGGTRSPNSKTHAIFLYDCKLWGVLMNFAGLNIVKVRWVKKMGRTSFWDSYAANTKNTSSPLAINKQLDACKSSNMDPLISPATSAVFQIFVYEIIHLHTLDKTCFAIFCHLEAPWQINFKMFGKGKQGNLTLKKLDFDLNKSCVSMVLKCLIPAFQPVCA